MAQRIAFTYEQMWQSAKARGKSLVEFRHGLKSMLAAGHAELAIAPNGKPGYRMTDAGAEYLAACRAKGAK